MVKKKICIIQARLGSSRLPSKVLEYINNKPLIYWVIMRALKTKIYDEFVVAIPRKDFLLKKTIEKYFKGKVNIFLGPENNVLKRFYMCAKKYNGYFITRVTADDPLKDINICKKSFLYFKNSKLDYYSNTIKQTYPIGIDIEHFTFKALSKTFNNARKNFDKEHVTSYIKRNKKKFKIKNFALKKNFTTVRLTVDNKTDLKLVRMIYKKFIKNPFVGYRKVINYLNKS